MRLGVFPRGVDPGDMTKSDPVEVRGFFDRAESEGFVLAVKKAESGWVDRGIVGYCFYVHGLFRASQSVSMRFTSDLVTSCRKAVMVSDESEGSRTVESAAICAVFHFPR